MNRRALIAFVEPTVRIRYAQVDDPRALERVVEILARLVKERQAR